MDRDSSDDDDDRQTLIHQTDPKHLPARIPGSPNRPTSATAVPRSTFQINDLESQICRRFKLNFSKRYLYLFAIFVPLLAVVIFFSADIKSLFSSNFSSLPFDSITDQSKEAELRALYLLNQQRTSLLALWNQTSAKSNFSEVKFDDLKGSLLEQIDLSRQIEEVLLSRHRTGNSTSPAGVFDTAFGLDRCGKVDQKLSERKTIEWKPKADKYLLAICLSGQMSNHLICLEKHMFFAALLNRVLVIPSSKFDFDYSTVLDIEHINDCLGRKVVVTFDEFIQSEKHHAHIDRFVCYFSDPQPCYVDEDHLKKLKGLGISMGKLESAWKEDVKKPSKKFAQEVTDKFGSGDDVIAIGDVFYADVESRWVMQPGGPIAHKCKTLIEPGRLIILTAERFVQTFLGNNYVALHFRRHGFLKFCNAKRPSCFYPIPQAADCITKVAERANAPVIYLSTDAAESETGLLQSLIMVDGKLVPLVKRPARNSAEKWDALLYRHGIDGDSQVEAMLDKAICALSSVFIGASGSTFTEDILRLRRGWGTASLCDEYLCKDEGSNFIAGDE